MAVTQSIWFVPGSLLSPGRRKVSYMLSLPPIFFMVPHDHHDLSGGDT